MNIKFLLLGFLIIQLSSCECDEEVNCRGIHLSTVEQLPHRNNDQLLFTNGSDSNLTFIREALHIDAPEVKDCFTGPMGDCVCPDCDVPSISNRYILDQPLLFPYTSNKLIKWTDTINGNISTRDSLVPITLFHELKNYNIFGNDDEENSWMRISYSFLDCNNWIELIRNGDLGFQLQLDARTNDTLLQEYSTPNHTYSNVVLSFHGTSKTRISKLYYSIEEGVIAFSSFQDSLFFYRE